jgi:hypothetical protein
MTMKHTPFFPRRMAVLLAVATMALHSPQASAQWIVKDPFNYMENLVHSINQLDQLAVLNAQQLQQLQDYRLQLLNLQKLGGTLRQGVQSNLGQQLTGNVNDYGRSLLNKTATRDPNSSSYYMQAEDIVSTSIGDVPRTTAATDVDLGNVGLGRGQQSGMGREAYQDRQQYDRVMDDVRQGAITRKNSETRAVQANAMANQMANLGDNNTVGAIQLLSAQNSLAYAQQEDLIKNQAALLKDAQERQLRSLVEKEAYRKRELERLSRLKSENINPAINMIP